MPRTQLVIPRAQSRFDRFERMLRALWRDTSALWREFRVPILVFLGATLGGGYLYGELLVYAGYERVPYIDLPYMMLALMILETTTDVPPEPYLIIFWYTMPAIALYVIGRGASDFVRLFFNRGERRTAWEEAVASTYRNHIIVLGVGHVGMRVIRTLVQMGFEVVAVDMRPTDDIDQELRLLNVPVITGDGRHSVTLDKAGLQHAQAFVICTSDDHINLEAIMRARDLNPTVRIVVRMWDSQFAEQLKRFMGVEAVLSASDLAAPVFAGSAVGLEITQTLLIHGVEYSMIRLQVAPGSFMEGETITELQSKNDMDIVLHSRNNDSVDVHPDGEICVEAGDTLVLFARHSQITSIVARNRRR